MKQSAIWGFILFSAGLLAGHYHVTDIIRGFITAEERLGVEIMEDAPENKPISSNGTLKASRSTHKRQPAINSQDVQQEKPVSQDYPGLLPNSYPPELTAEEQAQFTVQRREAMEAQVHQIEAMILSMKENGLPEQDIAAFGEMKKAMEDQLSAESENQEADIWGDMDGDFAASLEQMGLSPTERDKMMEEILSPRESATEGTGGMGIEPMPPYGR